VVGFYDSAMRATAKCYLSGADTWRTPGAATLTGAFGPADATFSGNVMQRGPSAGGSTAGTSVQGYYFRTEAEFNMTDLSGERQSYSWQFFHI
jgi:hypothetical protein